MYCANCIVVTLVHGPELHCNLFSIGIRLMLAKLFLITRRKDPSRAINWTGEPEMRSSESFRCNSLSSWIARNKLTRITLQQSINAVASSSSDRNNLMNWHRQLLKWKKKKNGRKLMVSFYGRDDLMLSFEFTMFFYYGVLISVFYRSQTRHISWCTIIRDFGIFWGCLLLE